MKMSFYRCSHCGQIVMAVKPKEMFIMCCLEVMQELVPGDVDAPVEKHVPIYEVKDGLVNVTVGMVEHPMFSEHYIEWIALQTRFGNQIQELKPGRRPKVSFPIMEGDEVLGVYSYCNLHGLWKEEPLKRTLKNWCRNRSRTCP